MSALLEVSGLSVTFDGFRAINNLSFSIGPAELRAIIGPNGAGKTTFMDIVTGKTRPDSGTVTFGERSISLLTLSEAQIARAGIGRKFQRPTVFEDQTVAENLTLALTAARGPWPVLFWKAGPADRARVGELAEQVGIKALLQRKSGELSHGQKQWLEIAMLLAQEPKLLLVDLAREKAVVVVEHDMEFVRRLNCRVTVLHEGAVLAEGSLDHVTRNPDVIKVYLGRG